MATQVNSRPKQQFIGNYEIFKTLGKGSFASVKLAVHRLTKQKVAIKIVDKKKLPDEYSLKNLHREAQIMRLLNHPNIIQMYEIMETKRELFLVLEYAAGGEVLDYIVAHERLKESEAKKLVKQIVDALEYCHSANIVHRDLKAENLLLDEQMNIKVTDFGLSNKYNKDDKLNTYCGSPVYSAPELIEGKNYVGPEVDLWSLGVNIYAMVVGELPFAENNINALYDAILAVRYKIPDYISIECRDLITNLLIKDPAGRYTIAQVKEHPWLLDVTPAESLVSLNNLANAPRTLVKPHTVNQIDEEILNVVVGLGFDRSTAINSLTQGKYDQVSATYFLLAKHKEADYQKKRRLQRRYEINMRNAAEKESKKNIGETPNETAPKGKNDIPIKENAKVKPQNNDNEEIKIIPTISIEKNEKKEKTAKQAPSVNKSEEENTKKRNRSNTVSACTPAVLNNQVKKSTDMLQKMTIAEKSTEELKFPEKKSPSNVNSDTKNIQTNFAKSVSRRKSYADADNTSKEADEDYHDMRSIRFAFNCANTSSKPGVVILEIVKKALEKENIKFVESGYVVTGVLKKGDSKVQMEVEVCKIPRLKLHGIRLKRLAGDIWEYKRLCKRLKADWEALLL